MPASDKADAAKNLPGIFISYRRSDTPDAVGRIYDRLVAEFGKARVFKDVDSIPLGQDFRGHLNDIVGGCAAVLAIIGPKWTDIRNEAGNKRLEDPDDFVRIELEAALARSVPVVPVLVGHAPMPGSSQLPSTLSSLAFRQSIEVRPDPDFHHDATRLVVALRQIIDPNAPREEIVPASAISSHNLSTQRGLRRTLAWVTGLAATLAVAAIAFAIPALKYLRETPPPETRLEISTPASDEPGNFALSPDGRQIVFAANSEGVPRLWQRSLATTTAQLLPGTEGANNPFWSPDSRSIGFFSPGGLKRLDLAGGQPQTLVSGISIGIGAWSANGVILYSGVNTSLMRVTATGGAATEAMSAGTVHVQMIVTSFLPDGRFLFLSSGVAAGGIYLGALDGSKPIRLTAELSLPRFLPSGWMLWTRGQVLVAQRLDLRKGALIGEPVTLANGVVGQSVSNTGLVAYQVGSSQFQLSWVDHTGKLLGTLGAPDDGLVTPRIAPDGRRVAASRTGSNQDIWLLDGARAGRLTFDASAESFPAWSPDGARIAFMSNRSGSNDIYQKPASGAGADELVLAAVGYPLGWSSDGLYLLYATGTPQTKGDIWVLPMAGDRKPFAFLNTPFFESRGQFSPDGRWVAYQSDESGNNEVYVRPFVPPDAARKEAGSSAVAGQWQVSTTGGVDPVWRADGKEIFFISPAGDMMAAPIEVSGSAVVPGTPVKLFAAKIYGGGASPAGRQYDVARDGRFLIRRAVEASFTSSIILLQNWDPNAGK